MTILLDMCTKCGSDRLPDDGCSRCAGYGLVTGMGGDPTECSSCQGAGIVYPPRCPDCSAFRKVALRDPTGIPTSP